MHLQYVGVTIRINWMGSTQPEGYTIFAIKNVITFLNKLFLTALAQRVFFQIGYVTLLKSLRNSFKYLEELRGSRLLTNFLSAFIKVT